VTRFGLVSRRSSPGRDARPGGSTDASPGRTRLVAVLGYSTRRSDGLHPICAARLEAAERAAEGAEAVLLSGWSRRRHRPSEAELMRDAWQGPAVRLVADGDARTTAGNAHAVAAAARELDADEVVLVTSSWHARRARLLVRAALGPNVSVQVVTPAPDRRLHLVGRELACLVPTGALLALRATRAAGGGSRPDSSRAAPPGR
jgi:uncharacterized SAM-binding protein YcdF (DUF218 family)